MQVKKATFQRTGGKGRTENRWDVSGAGHRKYLTFPGKYIKESQPDRQGDIFVPGDTTE